MAEGLSPLSHPARARALGREDRDAGVTTRRTMQSITSALGLSEGTFSLETWAQICFELRAAYDAAFDLPAAAVS